MHAPKGDVDGLRAVLADPQIGAFDVECIVDQETSEVKRKIEEFFQAGGLNDLLVLYISGHGVKSEDGRLYFATSSTLIDFLDATAIEDFFVARQMSRPRTRTRSIVLILDCCHSGAFQPGRGHKGAHAVHVAERFTTNAPIDRSLATDASGHVVLTASSDLEYAFEDMKLDEINPSEPGSLFTRFIVEGLQSGDADLDRDGAIAIDELFEYAYVRTRAHSPHQTPTMISRTNGRLIIAGARRGGDGGSTRPGREVQRLQHDGPVRSVAFSPAADRVGSAGDDRSARVWDVTSGRELVRFIHPPSPWSRKLCAVAFGPSGDCIATASRDRTARVWPLSDSAEPVLIKHGSWVRAVSFSPDGQFVASAGNDRTVRVWSLSERRALPPLSAAKALYGLAFSHDSTRLATAGYDHSACVWDLIDDRELQLVTHDGIVWAVAFSPDGASLATASDDHTAKVWKLGEPEPLLSLSHDSAVWAVAFSPDGRQIATAGADVFVRVWDLDDHREVLRVQHGDVVSQVTFSPDGRLLATASADHTARLWEV